MTSKNMKNYIRKKKKCRQSSNKKILVDSYENSYEDSYENERKQLVNILKKNAVEIF